MQYVWIVMLAIAWLIWCVASVVDFVRTTKQFKNPFEAIEEYTMFFILSHIVALFIYSLYLYVN